MAGNVKRRVIAAVTLAWLAAGAGSAEAQTLDRIAASKAVRIGFIADQAPFAAKGSDAAPQGYSIELCGKVVESIAQRVAGLQPTYVETTLADAFDAVAAGRIDMLCGAVTATLGRRESVDFSEPIFVTGMGALVRTDSPRDLRELIVGDREISPPRSRVLRAFATSSVGVRAGTTTEAVLRRAMQAEGYKAAIVAVATHQEGIAALESRQIDAYFADRGLLIGLLEQARDATDLLLADRLFTHESYGIALARGDAEFRLLVDRTLTQFYGTPAFAALLQRFFGERAADLQASIMAQSLPE